MLRWSSSPPPPPFLLSTRFIIDPKRVLVDLSRPSTVFFAASAARFAFSSAAYFAFSTASTAPSRGVGAPPLPRLNEARRAAACGPRGCEPRVTSGVRYTSASVVGVSDEPPAPAALGGSGGRCPRGRGSEEAVAAAVLRPNEARASAARPNDARRWTPSVGVCGWASASSIAPPSLSSFLLLLTPNLRPAKKFAKDIGLAAGACTLTPKRSSCFSRSRMRAVDLASASTCSCDLSFSSVSVMRSISRSIDSGVSTCSLDSRSCSDRVAFSFISCETCTSFTSRRRCSSCPSRLALPSSFSSVSARRVPRDASSAHRCASACAARTSWSSSAFLSVSSSYAAARLASWAFSSATSCVRRSSCSRTSPSLSFD